MYSIGDILERNGSYYVYTGNATEQTTNLLTGEYVDIKKAVIKNFDVSLKPSPVRIEQLESMYKSTGKKVDLDLFNRMNILNGDLMVLQQSINAMDTTKVSLEEQKIMHEKILSTYKERQEVINKLKESIDIDGFDFDTSIKDNVSKQLDDSREWLETKGKNVNPEAEKHQEELLKSKGEPTKEEKENARTTESTPEKESHKEESERPKNERTKDSAEVAKNGSQEKKKRKTSGNTGVPSGSSKSVDSVIARKQVRKGKLGILGSLSLGAGAIMDYTSRVNDGDSTLEAVAGTTANAALAYVIGPGIMLGAEIATAAGKGAYEVGETLIDKTREVNRLGTMSPFAANRFIETRDTFTMRQAAMAAIGQARGNLENAMIGNEAGMFHR